MYNLWLMFDHIKRVKDWTTMACHVYDSKYCKVLTIACCDMQYEDGVAHTLIWDSLNVVMTNNGVTSVNFKGFMADSAQASWNAMRKVHGDGHLSLPMVGHERTCFFSISQPIWIRLCKSISNPPYNSIQTNMQGLQGRVDNV